MDVRDAVEADAERLAELTGSPRDVMRNLVHDRTVRVVERDRDRVDPDDDPSETDTGDEAGAIGADSDPSADADGTAVDSAAVCGFVSYDARADTVHVTQLEGEATVADRLLEEPLRFADREGMAVELLAPEGESETREAAERAGFERAGTGPTFEGERTVRYRLDPR